MPMGRQDDPAKALGSILRGSERDLPERWRAWARDLMTAPMAPMLLASLWSEVLAFDDILACYIAKPVSVPRGTVIVAGSGKEDFKTFNVSTAASLLAAAAGVPVVKGVSRSVSAVSGAADVLEALDIPTVSDPRAIEQRVAHDGIAFISYATFCPIYAGRYDGVFPVLSPFSFFMPVSVLAVGASSYVYGVAHPDVDVAAATIHQTRPDLPYGIAVATELTPGELVDEQAGFGLIRTATTANGAVTTHHLAASPASSSWREAVAHGPSHAANTRLLLASLQPDRDTVSSDLVERNAALIVSAALSHQGDEEYARDLVRHARLDGRAQRLVRDLANRDEVMVGCLAS